MAENVYSTVFLWRLVKMYYTLHICFICYCMTKDVGIWEHFEKWCFAFVLLKRNDKNKCWWYIEECFCTKGGVQERWCRTGGYIALKESKVRKRAFCFFVHLLCGMKYTTQQLVTTEVTVLWIHEHQAINFILSLG